jgi:hypothetical protein
VFDKGVPEQCTLSTSAPAMLLTTQAGAFSPLALDLSTRSADHLLGLFSTAVYCGWRVWQALIFLAVAVVEPGDTKLNARPRHEPYDESCLGPWPPR